MHKTVEESLRLAENRAAVLRYLADLASRSPVLPDERVMSGISDLCEEIESTVRSTRRSLDVEVLGKDEKHHA